MIIRIEVTNMSMQVDYDVAAEVNGIILWMHGDQWLMTGISGWILISSMHTLRLSGITGIITWEIING